MDREMMRGISLIEILVVTVLIMTILSFATIQFSKWIKRYSIESDIKDIVAFLQSVRQKAFAEKFNFTVGLNGKSLCYRCSDTDAECQSRYGTSYIDCISLRNSFAANNTIGVTKRGTFSPVGSIYYPQDTDAAYNCVVVSLLRVSFGYSSFNSSGSFTDCKVKRGS